ncbi:hypothetical protein Lal_00029929 [Lupinus albus]|nr:hypothetical protein Lal_00029929 [Lupinus albus]
MDLHMILIKLEKTYDKSLDLSTLVQSYNTIEKFGICKPQDSSRVDEMAKCFKCHMRSKGATKS